MSVLIEAVSLVVPRLLLELRYPGGTDGFFTEMSRPSAEARYVCADCHLVSASFFTPEAADRAAAVLVSAGMADVENDQYRDFVIVDQKYGPLLHCHWLIWSPHPTGYTSAWLAGTDKGELAAPDGWTVAQSRRLMRTEASAMTGDVLELSEDNGIVTWLDFRSGRVLSSLRRERAG